jgi:hypothetical protein
MEIEYVFIYLQLLDLLTTLVGFKLGASEVSPFIRFLMQSGPAEGVLAAKVLALGLGAFCVYARKSELLRFASVWYSALVVWNLMVMLAAPGPLVK